MTDRPAPSLPRPFWRVLLLSAAAALCVPTAARAAWGEFDYQLDAYYTAVDFYVNLTTAPIPRYDGADEADIYKKLLFTSPVPRFLLLEASVNPLPLAGVWARRQAPDLYDRADLNDETNLVRAATTGFEEPWAVSAFLGNIIDFRPVKTKKYGEGRGHVGYLASAGNHHIKDNLMVKDDWWEAEWKIKGERLFPDLKLKWSFRLGAKSHSNAEIADAYYAGFRRSRTDYGKRGFSWYHNSGFSYKFDASRRGLAALQHQLVVDKKFPLEGRKWVPALSVGFLWRTRAKYEGSLQDAEARSFRLVFQPNVEF
jgi:hypothetical protein